MSTHSSHQSPIPFTTLRFFKKSLGSITLTPLRYDKKSVEKELVNVFGVVFQTCTLYVEENDKNLRECTQDEDLTGCHLYLSSPTGEIETSSISDSTLPMTWIDSRQVDDSNEGLPQIIIPRTGLFLKALDHLEKYRILCVRAPPASGKTAFGTLLKLHLMRQNEYECTFISLLRNGSKGTKFDDFFQRLTNLTWFEFLAHVENSQKRHVLIMDEIQYMFDIENNQVSKVETFWNSVRFLQQKASNLRIVFLTTRGYLNDEEYPLPVALNESHCWSFNDLRFDDTEMEMYFRFLFTVVKVDHDLDSSKTLISLLKYLTGGYAGCLSYVSSFLRSHKHVSILFFDKNHWNEFVWDIATSIRTLGILQQFHKHKYGKEMRKMALEVAQTVQGYRATSEIATNLIKYGLMSVFVGDNARNYLDFTCPMFFQAFCTKVFTPMPQYYSTDSKSLPSLILSIVKCLSANTLRASHSDKLSYETVYQMEFYRIAFFILGSMRIVLPDASLTRFCDFIVKDKKWGIELLRNGQHLENPMKRFMPNGQYFPMEMSHWISIDFRDNAELETISKEPHCITVYFESNFTKARFIQHVNGEKLETELILLD